MKSINTTEVQQKEIDKQKGYSIIELSIALAIISLILVGSLAGVQRVLRSNNINKDLTAMNLLASRLTTISSNMGTTAGTTMATLNSLNAFEGLNITAAAVAGADPTISNSFGGSFVVAPNTAAVGGYAAGGGFIVYSTGIPSAACPDLLLGLNNLSPQITTDIGALVPAVIGATFANVAKAVGVNNIPAATLIISCTPAVAQGGKVHIAAFIPKG